MFSFALRGMLCVILFTSQCWGYYRLCFWLSFFFHLACADLSWNILRNRNQWRHLSQILYLRPSLNFWCFIFPACVARLAWEPGPRCLAYPCLFLSLSLQVESSAREWLRLLIGVLSQGFAWWWSPLGWAGATLFHRERRWLCCGKRVDKNIQLNCSPYAEQNKWLFLCLQSFRQMKEILLLLLWKQSCR